MTQNKQRRKITSPAFGEKGAISGYNFQYESTAYLIIKYLKKRQLKWVKFIDPEAGRLDDLQLNVSDVIYAYQMKWSGSSNYLSFNQISFSSHNKPSIIKQLTEGWKKLRNQHGNNIKVCFLTNMSPSKNDNLFQNNESQKKAFKNFINEEWNNRDSFTPSSIPAQWKEVWKKILSESNLSEKDFLEFIRDCEFIFSFNYPTEINSPFPEDFQNLNKDINKLSSFISQSIAQTANLPLQLTSQELLNKLNWSDRIEYKNIHIFPVEKIYEPIETSKKKLINAIETVDSGYILLQGTPGSGKSSLLSASLKDSEKLKVIKYFCYIPDDRSIVISRGESVNFLHDISQQLETLGYNAGESLNSVDLSFLQKKLQHQLEQIRNKYQESKKKVIIIVDGLDHIQREMEPQHSLLSALPLPNSLPQGVVFLLSSQLDKLNKLPAKIEEQIRKQDRKIIMDKLPQEAVLKVIDKLKLKISLSDDQKDIIFEKCEGHPLALKLILKKISRITENIQINSELQNIDRFDQSIEKVYYSHWKQIEENTSLVKLLGLVSRLTEGIDWNWVSQWENQETIDIFKIKLWYYFEEENEKWYFFHNSFRVFIERKTIEKPHRGIDRNKDKEFHKYLAKEIKKRPDKFEEIFHLYKAEAYQSIVDISTQQYFKNQIDNFCHPSFVLDNIRLSILASGKLNNLEHIFNLTLSASTTNLVESYLFEGESPDKLIKLLLKLGKFELAQSYIRKRRTLLVPKGKAVEFIIDFLNFGHRKEASLLFEISKPVECLIDKKVLDIHRDRELIDLVENWLFASIYFYTINEVCDLIISLKIKEQEENHFSYITENGLKAKIFYRIGKALINRKDWNNLEVVFKNLKELNQMEYYFHLLSYSWRLNYQINEQISKKYFKLATNLNIKNNDNLLELAYGYLFINKDKKQSKEIVKQISYPKNQPKISSDNFSPLIYRFKLIRLMVALNISFSLEDLIPIPKKNHDFGLILLERNFGKLAILWGKYLSGRRMTPETLKVSILPLIQFYNKNFLSITDWTHSYSISKSRKDFCHLLISFIELAYPNELMNIFKLFKSQWTENDIKDYWDNDIKRTIISRLLDAGCPIELKNELNNLKVGLPTESMHERIDDYLDHANLLIKFDQKEKAEKLLKYLVSHSIHIGWRKDSQLTNWIDWLELYNKKEPNGAKNRIEKYMRYILIANRTTERSGAYIALGQLIQVATNHSPVYAFKLSNWLLDNGLSFADYIDYLITALMKNNHISFDVCFSIIKNILLPISRNDECHAIEMMIRKMKNESEDKIKTRALELVKSINCYSFPSNRNSLRRNVIQSLDEIGFDWIKLRINWDDVRDTRSSSDNYELEVNGQRLNFFELEKKTQSISDLINFKRSSSNSFFKWENLIKRKKHLISKNCLLILREEFKETSNWNNILYILSDHFYSIGETDISLDLAEELFKNSKYYSWTWFYGEERINSFKALKNHKNLIDLKQKVIQTLADDSQQFHGYLNIALEFDEIFKLMSKEVPIKTVWPAIDEFLDRLFSFYDMKEFPFPKINEPETKSELPIEFQILLPLLSHHVNLISQGAYLAINDLFSKTNNKNLIGQIIDKSDDEQQALLLNILIGMIFYHPSKKSLISVDSLKKIQSDNFYVRMLNQNLLKELDNNYVKNYIGKTNERHKLYELVFPEPKPFRLHGIEQYDERRVLPDTNNPLENIRMYKSYIEELSVLSGIEEINLAIRVGQIMDNLTGINSYGSEAEQELRSNLAIQNLKLTFRRPRALVARRAICHLISELVDAMKIKQKDALMIAHTLSYIDPLIANLGWSHKPDFIQYNLPESRVPDNWIDEPINKVQLNIGTEVGSMIIVGEICKIKSMDWLVVSEEIEQVLSFSKTFKSNQSVQINSKCLYQDYPKNLDSLDILYLNPGIYFDTKQSSWLAIHPLLMNQYGMRLSKEKPFIWLSNDGKIIAQTIFWKSGTIEHSSSSYKDQCGEGALCLLDKNFLNKILSKNKVYLKAKRERHHMDNKNIIRKSVTLCEPYSN